MTSSSALFTSITPEGSVVASSDRGISSQRHVSATITAPGSVDTR